MKFSLATLAVVGFSISEVVAFPHLTARALQDLLKREPNSKRCPFSQQNNQKHSKRQVGFDPKAQYVSTTGANAWVAPNLAAGDKRGPCPGLNALANHGYLPHNGIAPMNTIIQAVNQAYGMALDLGTFLAVYGTVFDGNSVSLTPGYSIGGPSGLGDILSSTGLLRTPSGLSGSHNNYEAIPQLPAVTSTLQIDLFQRYYNALLVDTPAPQQYSALFPFRQSRFNDSIKTNPYFFFPQFAGVLVAPAGFAFPPAMMSNHSAKYPQGYLDRETFKSFFAVSGQSGNFTYQPGYERIPDSWYKRAIGDEYTIADYLVNVLEYGTQDPRLLSPGGNTGTTNSFTGVSVTNFSKGVFNGATLAQGNNLQCFVFQLIQAEAPGLLTGIYENVTMAMQPLVDNIQGNLKGLNCPQLMGLDESQYGSYPGYKISGGAV